MNCPLCHRKLKLDPEYNDNYLCRTKITYPDCIPVPHYEVSLIKGEDGEQDEMDQHWYVGPYKLEMDNSGLSIYKITHRGYKPDYPVKPYDEYIMYLEIKIPVDDSNKMINRIKTMIVFS